jgi:hypothetical protein
LTINKEILHHALGELRDLISDSLDHVVGKGAILNEIIIIIMSIRYT